MGIMWETSPMWKSSGKATLFLVSKPSKIQIVHCAQEKDWKSTRQQNQTWKTTPIFLSMFWMNCVVDADTFQGFMGSATLAMGLSFWEDAGRRETFVPWVSKAMMLKMQSGSQVRQKRDMENIEGRERKKKHKNVQQLWCQKKEQRGKHPNEVCCWKSHRVTSFHIVTEKMWKSHRVTPFHIVTEKHEKAKEKYFWCSSWCWSWLLIRVEKWRMKKMQGTWRCARLLTGSRMIFVQPAARKSWEASRRSGGLTKFTKSSAQVLFSGGRIKCIGEGEKFCRTGFSQEC